MNRLKEWFRKLKAFFASKKGIVTNALISVSFLAIFIGTYVPYQNMTSYPAVDFPTAFKDLRAQAMRETKEMKTPVSGEDMWVRADIYSYLSKKDSETSPTYYLFFSPNDLVSDFMELSYTRNEGDINIGVGIWFDYLTYDVASEERPFRGIISFTVPSLDPAAKSKNLTGSVKYELGWDGAFSVVEDTIAQAKFDAETMTKISALITPEIENFAKVLPDFGTKFGFDAKKLLNELPEVIDDFQDGVYTYSAVSFIFAVLAVPHAMLSFIFLLKRVAVKRAAEGRSKLKLQEGGSIEEAMLEKEVKPAAMTIEELGEGSTKRFALAIRKTKLKPCIREWPIRLIGIGILVFTAVWLGVSRAAPGWGSGAVTMFEAAGPWVKTVQALANLILVITVVTIICETHRFLLRNSIVFFTLGLMYYVGVSLLVGILLRWWTSVLATMTIQIILTAFLPGNIFFGVGIFSFVGFFLFESPDRNFINRKVFRWLSAIPVALVIVSMNFRGILQAASIGLSPWTANLLFTRDPSFYIVGIAYEYVIFGMRRHYAKRYGEDKVESIEELPEIQMTKNIVLCGLILFLTIAFYCIPTSYRDAMGFPAPYSFAFLAVPLLLFQQPTRQNRKAIWDLYYYIAFFTTMILPNIIEGLIRITHG